MIKIGYAISHYLNKTRKKYTYSKNICYDVMKFIEILKKFTIGITYGISFPLTIVILDYWLKDCGISNTTIGLLSFSHLPFLFKFFFATIVDKYKIPYLSKKLGKHRSWVVFSQIMLIISVFCMSSIDPKTNLFILMTWASLVALFDGLQNISLYPYQISNINKNNKGYGAGIVCLGHRIGAIMIKVTTLYAANFWNWKIAYRYTSFLIFICMIFILLTNEPDIIEAQIPKSLQNPSQKKKAPLSSTFSLFNMHFYILAIIVLYKTSDFIIQKMSRPFFLEIGFSKLEIANISQFCGSISVIIGSFICGFFIKKYGTLTVMKYSGIIHTLSFLFYCTLIIYQKNYYILSCVIFFEGITGGAISTAFITFFYDQCKNKSQYALLWAIHEVTGILYKSLSGIFADFLGWSLFFIITPLLSIPGIIFLIKLEKSNQHMQATFL